MAKTMFISGASRGIGKAIALAAAENGYDLLLTAKNTVLLKQTANEIRLRFSTCKVHTFIADLAIAGEVDKLIREVNETCACIDVLVNNAGVFQPGNLMQEPEGQFEQLMTTNLFSIYHLTRGLLPLLRVSSAAQVFTICSIASLAAYDNGGSYSVSKFALLGFTKNLRKELASEKIKVTAILPGATLTDSWAGTDLPADRFIQASDIAALLICCLNLSAGALVEELLIQPVAGPI